MERSLILTSTNNSGKKLQKAISDINPQASAEALKGFTQKLNALTTNTYVQTDCIDKFNVDTEIPPVDNRQDNGLIFNHDNWLKVSTNSATTSSTPIAYQGDGTVSLEVIGDHGVVFWCHEKTVYSRRADSTIQPTPGQVTLRVSGTENFKPKEIEFTVE